MRQKRKSKPSWYRLQLQLPCPSSKKVYQRTSFADPRNGQETGQTIGLKWLDMVMDARWSITRTSALSLKWAHSVSCPIRGSLSQVVVNGNQPQTRPSIDFPSLSLSLLFTFSLLSNCINMEIESSSYKSTKRQSSVQGKFQIESPKWAIYIHAFSPLCREPIGHWRLPHKESHLSENAVKANIHQ